MHTAAAALSTIMTAASRHSFAEPHPELLIPTHDLRRAQGAELLAQLVAVLLLLVAWVMIVWFVSSGILGATEEPPQMPVLVEVERPYYLTA